MRTLLKALAVLAVLYFAIEGGEYGTSDLLSQGRRERALTQETDSLQRVVDSLIAYRRAVQTDPAVQERIAREEFGMVRGDRELLYRYAEDQPAGSRRDSTAP